MWLLLFGFVDLEQSEIGSRLEGLALEGWRGEYEGDGDGDLESDVTRNKSKYSLLLHLLTIQSCH